MIREHIYTIVKSQIRELVLACARSLQGKEAALASHIGLSARAANFCPTAILIIVPGLEVGAK